jgi:hypothetical protein
MPSARDWAKRIKGVEAAALVGTDDDNPVDHREGGEEDLSSNPAEHRPSERPSHLAPARPDPCRRASPPAQDRRPWPDEEERALFSPS